MRALADSVAGVLAYVDRDERIVFVSEGSRELHCVAPEEVVGRTLREISSEIAYAWVSPYIRRALAGETVEYDRSHRRPDGTVTEIRARLVPDRGADGTVRGYCGLFTDVTDLVASKRALAAAQARLLRRQEALSRLAASEANAGGAAATVVSQIVELAATELGVERASLWVFDEAHGAIVCEDLYESTPQRHSSGTRLLASDYPRYFAALAGGDAIDAGDAHADPRTSEFGASYLKPLCIGAMLDAPIIRRGRTQGVLCCEHVGGPRTWNAEDRLFAVTLANHAALVLEGAARGRAEEALRASEHSLSALFANLPGYAYRCANDRDWTLEFASGGVEALTGHAASDFVVRRSVRFADLIHEDDRARVWDAAQAALARRESFELEYRITTRSGEERWVWDRGQGIFSPQGDLLRIEGLINDITDRKRAEESLRLSEARFQDFARASGDWFWETDAEGRFTWFVDSGKGVPGVAAQGLQGRKRTDLVARPQDLEAEPWKSHLEALERREEFRDFRSLRRGSIGELWVSASGVPVYAPDGAFLGYRGTSTDVTRQVALERAARLADERLRSAVELLDEPVALTDADEHIVLANRAFREAYPDTAQAGIGKPYESFLRELIALGHLPDAIGREDAWLAERIAQRRRGSGSHEQRRRNGAWIRVSDQRLPDGSTITFTLDITQSKRAAEDLEMQNRELERRVAERTAALAASEARLRAVIDAVPMPIICKDRGGKLLLCNAAATDFAGQDSPDLLGNLVRAAWMDPDVIALLDAADRRARETGSVQVLPGIPLLDRTGREIIVVHTRIPFRFSSEHADAVLGVVQDVTELKAAERELQRFNQELEGRVAARTAELAAAGREMEAFSYSISHDLRAPARAMSGFAGILLEDHASALPGDARKLVERITAAGVRMGAMIDGLLELARLSRTAVRRKPVDLAALARETWSEVAANEPNRTVAFSSPQSCMADCDPVLIRNVLQNLLGNAFKYTRRTPVARVEFGAIGEGAERIFFVRDNGAGFDMAHAGKLFGTFQRLHGANEFEGTGVGLSTVQRILERHGGRIWAEASPGEGASFQFTLGAADQQ